MNTPLLSSALRETHQDFGHPITWAALAGVGVVLALAGAFGTDAALRPAARGIYWIAVAVLTYGAGAFVAALVRARIGAQPQWRRILATGLASGIVIIGVVAGINRVVFGPMFDTLAQALVFSGTIFAVVFVVSGLLDLALSPKPQAAPPPALLQRLPLPLRAPLVALSVEDHYVRVRTTRGEAMLLMRLGDAMAEAGARGLQVHRSHWVALDQVAQSQRIADRAVLHMRHGPDIPVSRRYLPALREAGLMP